MSCFQLMLDPDGVTGPDHYCQKQDSSMLDFAKTLSMLHCCPKLFIMSVPCFSLSVHRCPPCILVCRFSLPNLDLCPLNCPQILPGYVFCRIQTDKQLYDDLNLVELWSRIGSANFFHKVSSSKHCGVGGPSMVFVTLFFLFFS